MGQGAPVLAVRCFRRVRVYGERRAVLLTVPARYRSPGPQLITLSWLCCSACYESHGPGRSKEWHPAADLHKFLTW
jgi:hypothetical protein